VGGDFVDYLSTQDDVLGVALGDVAGKGLGAALFMARLQATVRALAPGASSIAKLGEELNMIFCRDCLPSLFASLVYVELQPDSDRVRLLNAGHLPPIVIRHGKISEMPRGTPALGLTYDAPFKEQSRSVPDGAFMLIYSDGLVEAQNTRGEFFGSERLMDLLAHLDSQSAEEAGAFLLKEVSLFVGEAQPSDDISLVVLKRSSE